jgi:hypothetical protein
MTVTEENEAKKRRGNVARMEAMRYAQILCGNPNGTEHVGNIGIDDVILLNES